MKRTIRISFAISACFIAAGAYAQTDSVKYSGTFQKIIIPACVDSIAVDVYGAQGGASIAGATIGPAGDSGGRVQAVLPVTPGDSIFVYAGGHGDSAVTTGAGGAGGYNGGANGSHVNVASSAGGGGGGASDIRLNGTALADRIVVAGGAGGSGHPNSCGTNEPGGDGGGLTGGNGTDCTAAYAGGGTQSSGGAGEASAGPNSGASGTLGNGGAAPSNASGGGGGGGYYGGGGGYDGGGGGGSGYVETTASSVIQTTGYRAGNGLVVITMKSITTITASIDSMVSSGCTSYLWAVPSGGATPYTYAWAPVSSSADTLHNACQGSYTVTVTDHNGCSTTAHVYLKVTVTGIDEITNNSNIKVYPVPASGTLNIDILGNNIGLTSLSVYDITGRKVMEETTGINSAHLSINVSQLERGVYFLRMTGNQGPQKDIKFEVDR